MHQRTGARLLTLRPALRPTLRPTLLWLLTTIWALGASAISAETAFEVVQAETPREGFTPTPDGASIRHLEAGEGPALLFVPGWTLTAEIWTEQLERFAPSHRVVAIDPRGQGGSSRRPVATSPDARGRDLDAVIGHLGLAPATLVCWSMAVIECVSYLEQFGGEDVSGLVLVEGMVGADPDPMLAPGLLRWLGAFLRDRPAMAELFVRSMFHHPPGDGYIERLVEATLETPTPIATALYLGLLGTDKRGVLDRIDRPTLIVVAASSPWRKAYEQLRDGIAGSRLVVFEDAGHALFVDQPERFNSLLENFLAEIDRPRSTENP